MVLSYNRFLFEYNANLKYVYHIVDFNKLNFILTNNQIKSYKFSKISTTRDPNLNGYVGDSSTSVFKIELDYQKLANDYEINEFVYKSRTGVSMEEEEEEQINTQQIDNIDKYITKIILVKDRMEHMKDTGWFKSRGGFYGKGKENIPNLLKNIVDKSSYQLWIQDGVKLYKDDNYIDSIINTLIELEIFGYALYRQKDIREKVVRDDVEQNYSINREQYTPLDDRNKPFIVDAIGIGVKHKDLYLTTKKPSQKDYDNGVCLLIFEIENNDDIISVDNGIIHVKVAKLENKRPHGWDGW